ncbi:MAG: serine/threonine-protein phosphatase [Bacteroidaceae bacterium]|nr:serine/threonine-protein phosphatase [Bacteroidaceae bacterium]
MKYKLNIKHIYELGKRDKQEDSIYPLPGEATNEDRLFIVCDGMGGHDSGEVASKTVCEALSEKVLAISEPDGLFTEEMFDEALSAAYDVLDTKDTGARKKMGTTMTFLKFHAGGCMMAHIGDSRIYQIRGGKILFQTSDHSLVNDFVKAELITPEQAKTHPQRNVITRAMQPLMEARSKADKMFTDNIQAGDYFLLCTDGLIENIEDEDFAAILSNEEWTDDEKTAELVRRSVESRDNHSAYLIHVLDVEDESPVGTLVGKTEPDVIGAEEYDGKTRIRLPELKSEESVNSAEELSSPAPLPPTSKPKGSKWWIILLVILAIVTLLAYLSKGEKQVEEKTKTSSTIVSPDIVDSIKVEAPQDTTETIETELPQENIDTIQVDDLIINEELLIYNKV